ncbi:4754_t:CDS:10 [Entrophospora sp. SA101]|nr:8315_t:CDS:10 [Entrophospora sp. SA101]CAJ0828581.1 4754_t:CDS:10 [Entrophospora sp. SA101]
MKKTKYSISSWKKNELHPSIADNKAIDWIFMVDLLNFSFWSELDKEIQSNPSSERFSIEYNNNRYTGYWSLCAAINRALEDEIPITTPSFYMSEKKLTDNGIRHIFRSATKEEMPLLDERIHSIREAGKVLVEKFGGSFVNCITRANKSAANLLKIITENFNSFRDESNFQGRKVFFYKRAQILIADIWACFEGKELGEFHDIDKITIVPQALYHLGALSYSPSLLNLLESFTLIPHDSRPEIEIRDNDGDNGSSSNSSSSSGGINAIILDYFIWDFASQNKHKLSPEAEQGNSVYVHLLAYILMELELLP